MTRPSRFPEQDMQHDTSPVNFAKHSAPIYQALLKTQETIIAAGLNPLLHHLVVLRASQINACAFCVKMHLSEARRDGETEARLDRLIVWRHVDDFTPAEKAALAWTEALTTLKEDTVFGILRARLREHFNEAQISALTATIAMINLWNRVQISQHA